MQATPFKETIKPKEAIMTYHVLLVKKVFMAVSYTHLTLPTI